MSTTPHPATDLLPDPTPVTPPRRARLLGLDAARGVALLGMMAVHALLLVDDDGNPTTAFTLAAGRSAALFAVLAGVGIALLTGRRRVGGTDAAPVAAALLTRAAVIGAIGLVLGYADVEYAVVILPFYAVLFVLAVPLVLLPTPLVAAVGIGAATVIPAALTWAADVLPEPMIDNPGAGDLIADPGRWLLELTLVGEFPALPWTAYLCAGLVVGRLRLENIDVAAALLLLGTTLAVGAHLTSHLLLHRLGGTDRILAATGLSDQDLTEILTFGQDGLLPAHTWWWLAVDAPHTSTTADLVATVGSSLIVLAVMLLAGHVTARRVRPLLEVLLVPLAAAGSMTLTLYVAHIWFVNSAYDIYSPTVGYLLQVSAALIIGLVVRFTAGRGPLEALTTAAATRARRALTPTTARP